MVSAREEVVFRSEEPRSVEEIGEFLVRVGKRLKEKGSFGLTQGDQQVEICPSGATKLELKYEVEGGTKHQFEIEIEWKPQAGGGGKVDVT